MSILQSGDLGQFDLQKIAAALQSSVGEVAITAGLGSKAMHPSALINSDEAQRRLRDLVEILTQAEPRFGSNLLAYDWYRTEPLPGFGGRTAMHLVNDGKAQEVIDYIDAVDAGIFA